MTQPPRVLELGGAFSAAYAAKLLGDHGADVVKVEPPEGDKTRRRGPFPGNVTDPEQSGTFLALNLNKRGVCLDLDAEGGRAELRKLIRWADILVHNYSRLGARALGLDPATLKSERPGLVVLSITPFGITGPYRDFAAEDLTVSNAGGWANLCPRSHTDPSLPPLKVFGQQCGMMAGIAGATAALATYRDARRSGVGDYIDLSEQAYIASGLEGAIPGYTYRGTVSRRYELSHWGTFDAKDGPILMLCMEESQWERIVEFMGRPAWTELEIFANQRTRTPELRCPRPLLPGVHIGMECVRAFPCGASPAHLPCSGDELRAGRVRCAPACPRFFCDRRPPGDRARRIPGPRRC